jgi:hypothetical protein
MSITLKKNNNKPNLEIPEFICDNGICNNPKSLLNTQSMLQHMNTFTMNGVIGRPGSGKTSMLLSFLTGRKDKKIFRKAFNNILLVMPESSRQSLKKNIFEKHPADKMYEELTQESIDDIYQKLLTYSGEENESSMLILDDVGASLKNNSIQQTLRKIIYNRRHLKCSIFILLQSYLSAPKEIRKMYNNIFVLYKPSKTEIENLFSELFETKKDLCIDIMNFVFKNPHDYLMLNIDSQKMYRDFDEIIINPKEIKLD